MEGGLGGGSGHLAFPAGRARLRRRQRWLRGRRMRRRETGAPCRTAVRRSTWEWGRKWHGSGPSSV
ncbi:hypothetical protein [Azospirillum largimobile]